MVLVLNFSNCNLLQQNKIASLPPPPSSACGWLCVAGGGVVCGDPMCILDVFALLTFFADFANFNLYSKDGIFNVDINP